MFILNYRNFFQGGIFIFNINKKTTKILNVLIIALSTLIILGGYVFLTNGKDFSNNNNYKYYKGKILEITGTADAGNDMISTSAYIEILNKDLKGQKIVASQLSGGLNGHEDNKVNPGDTFIVYHSQDGFALGEPYRLSGLMLLVGIFFIGLLILGKAKGLKTIISLSITCGAIFLLFIPSILAGYNIYLAAIFTAIFITLTTLPLVSGYNKKSLAAIIGCIGGVFVVGILTFFMNKILRLTGLSSQESILLLQSSASSGFPAFDLKGIAFASIILGALGATMDVAISISSSLYEFCKEVKDVTFKKALNSGLTIGKDIMGTMTNTLILAYIGSSLTSILLLIMYNGKLLEMINQEILATEILQALAGSIGMLLTIPITAVVATYLYLKVKKTKTDREILNK